MLGDNNVRSVGVLAAWCAAETHLLELEPCVDLYLAAGQHRRLCEYLASGGVVHTEGEVDNSVGQTRLTAAEISQRSVDLLLREYYQMVQAQHHAVKHADSSGALIAQGMFLLLCPTTPDWCDLKHVAAGVACVVRTAATVVVLLACVIVPFWLAIVRQLSQQQQLDEAAAVLVTGLSVMVLSDALHRGTVLKKHRAAATAVTPANMQQLLHSGSDSSELATLRQASKTVTTPNYTQALQQQQQQQLSTTPPPAPGPTSANGRGTGGLSFLSLLPAVSALQSALGVSSNETPSSREALAAEVQRLGDVLGVRLTPDMLATPAAMAATISQLTTSVGI